MKNTFAKKGGGRKEKKLRSSDSTERREMSVKCLSSFLFETLTSEVITARDLDRITETNHQVKNFRQKTAWNCL